MVHKPDNPLADADGNVRLPDIDMASQMTQLIMAQRGYQASASVTKNAQDTYQRHFRSDVTMSVPGIEAVSGFAPLRRTPGRPPARLRRPARGAIRPGRAPSSATWSPMASTDSRGCRTSRPTSRSRRPRAT